MIRAPECFSQIQTDKAVPVWPVTSGGLERFLHGRTSFDQAFVRGNGFRADPGKVLALPGEDGSVTGYIAGCGARLEDKWAGFLPSVLPEGEYRLEGMSAAQLDLAALNWGLGAYQYTAYRKARRGPARLAAGEGVPSAQTYAAVEATYFVRDLVNTPANDMLPDDLEAAACALASRHGAEISVLKGDELLRAGLNLIHAVGRASASAPRLIDIAWGTKGAPTLTLVGKGVCFDSGGLDIKNSAGMRLMKKDMGGAAHVLGLAHMIMSAGLHISLRVLVPAVENAISGSAFRPGDVLKSHKGLTVEIGNTDAEGRLILADALSVADAEAPDLLIDMATLTGAARAALGPDLPALFTDDEAFAEDLLKAGQSEDDPMWRLPLWAPYAKWLESPVADINNAGSKPMAGAVTAGLFLKRFVEKAKLWAHLDIYAWSVASDATRNVGAEAQTIRALYRVIRERVS